MGDPKDVKTSMNWSTMKTTPEQTVLFGKMLCKGIEEGALGVGHAVPSEIIACLLAFSLRASAILLNNQMGPPGEFLRIGK